MFAPQHHCGEGAWLQTRGIGSSCLLFNCLPNFNRSHLSLRAAKRQLVDILTPLRVFKTSRSTTSIHCLNPAVAQLHTQTHTHTQMSDLTAVTHSEDHHLLHHNRFPSDVSEGMFKKGRNGQTFNSQHPHIRGRWDSLLQPQPRCC